MGKYRIYPNKSNTLIEDSPNVNTGENEVMELWYGVSGLTRHLLQFDFDAYNESYALGYVPHATATTSTWIFHLENCYPIFEKYPYSTSSPATSSEISINTMNTSWDSGVGYNFYGRDTVDGYSNWNSATTVNAWTGTGGGDYSTLVFSGSIDKGYENVTCDITDAVALWNAQTGHNYGLVVKYSDANEALDTVSRRVLKFYTNNAKTKYKMPYIEVSWDDQVKDERDEVGHELTRRLYLYVKRYDIFSRPYDISGVTVTYDHPSYSDDFYPATAITEQYPGVYYIDYYGPVADHVGGMDSDFTDTWSVQFYSGESYTQVALSGDLHAETSQWSTDQSDVLEAIEYAIAMPNLAYQYVNGNIVYLDVAAYTQFTSNKNVVKNMDYKINLCQGDGGDFTMVDWSPVSYTRDINGFPLNTNWFHTGYTYSIYFRYSVNGAITTTSKDQFKFKVI